MNGLVDQGPSSVVLPRTPPSRLGIIFGRTEPFDLGRSNQGTPQCSGIEQLFQMDEIWVDSILKEASQLDLIFLADRDKPISLFQSHVDRFLHQNVNASCCRLYTLFGMNTRRTSDGNDIERPMPPEFLFAAVPGALELFRQIRHPFCILARNSNYFEIFNLGGSLHMRFGYVPCTKKSDMPLRH